MLFGGFGGKISGVMLEAFVNHYWMYLITAAVLLGKLIDKIFPRFYPTVGKSFVKCLPFRAHASVIDVDGTEHEVKITQLT